MKTISSKEEMMKVATCIENDMRKHLGVLNDYKWEFARRSCKDSETIVIYDTEWMIVSQYALNVMRMVFEWYQKDYRNSIIFTVSTYPCKLTDNGWLYTPSFEIMIMMK